MTRCEVAFLMLACLGLAACSSPKASTETPAAKEAKASKDEVTLSPEQQSAAMVETQAATLSQEPDMLRVKGRVALADVRTWRIGVRTVGSVVAVYAGLGDYVRKGQILARYHADEVRDSRAQYRAAVSELDRAKAAAVQAQRNRDRVCAIVSAQFGKDVLDSPLDGFLGDRELIRDLFIGISGCDQAEHVDFCRRQGIVCRMLGDFV